MEGVAEEKVGPDARNLRGIVWQSGGLCGAVVLQLHVSESPGGRVATLLGPPPGVSESVGLRLSEVHF